jgi:hypothetical protein
LIFREKKMGSSIVKRMQERDVRVRDLGLRSLRSAA